MTISYTTVFLTNFVAAAGTVAAALIGVALVVLARKAYHWWSDTTYPQE